MLFTFTSVVTLVAGGIGLLGFRAARGCKREIEGEQAENVDVALQVASLGGVLQIATPPTLLLAVDDLEAGRRHPAELGVHVSRRILPNLWMRTRDIDGLKKDHRILMMVARCCALLSLAGAAVVMMCR